MVKIYAYKNVLKLSMLSCLLDGNLLRLIDEVRLIEISGHFGGGASYSNVRLVDG